MFTSRDPLDGVNGTAVVGNAYHYGNNNPLANMDPTGMSSWLATFHALNENGASLNSINPATYLLVYGQKCTTGNSDVVGSSRRSSACAATALAFAATVAAAVGIEYGAAAALPYARAAINSPTVSRAVVGTVGIASAVYQAGVQAAKKISSWFGKKPQAEEVAEDAAPAAQNGIPSIATTVPGGMNSLPGPGDFPAKVVNTEMAHAAENAVVRAGFSNVAEARSALQELGRSIEASGFPAGTIADTNPDRVLVPFGNGGYAVYQVVKNGNAVLRNVLIAR